MGLIPAHAGKTRFRCIPAPARGAHPRACGENEIRCTGSVSPIGSSPRMRGKLLRVGPGAVTSGLIPAHAGKTSGFRISVGPSRAHPRACGENGLTLGRQALGAGSSPRMRGKRGEFVDDLHSVRLIPAHAGKTDIYQHGDPNSGAHPRACGENIILGAKGTDFAGSSPRMRGKRARSESC